MSNPFADTPEPTSDRAAPAAPTAPEERGVDVIGLVRRSLRGRWLLAAAAGVALAVPAALLGYNAASIEYAASVSVEVLQAPEITLYNVENDRERIREYLRRQDAEVRGQRVLEAAVNHPALQEMNWPTGVSGQRALRDSIRVEYNNLSTNFTVRAISESAAVANAALRAVIESYEEIHRERNSPAEREQKLDREILEFDSRIAQLNDSIEAATAEFGTSDLEPLITDAQAERRALENQIAGFEDQIALLEREGNQNTEVDPDDLDVQQLADFDDELARLLAVRDDFEAQLETLLIDLGSRHPSIKTLRQEIASIDRRIDDRIEDVRERILNQPFGPVTGGFTMEQLEFALDRAQKSLTAVNAELAKLNRTSSDIQRDQVELARLRDFREDLARQRSRLDIERENIQRGRIVIAPIAPAVVYDDKRKPFAAIGFMFGGATGVGLVIAYGAWRRTFRYVDDIDDPSTLPPLLGTLPELDRKDPDAERIAAVSVHNLRNTLHGISRRNEGDCAVVVCTSAEPADGKTTLIQSLGASYALTGLRTIIVDLDLVGGGLSARLGMSGRRGVADLLGGLEPTKCIKRTATEKLYALPAGDASACKPEQLAHRPVQQVIDWLRERFDVVLIDTGPVLGSLEAGLTVGLADHVLLVVPRGQSERLTRAAVTRLNRLGARSIGTVFNRADTTDLKQSLSAASIGAPSLRQTQRRLNERRLDQDASIVGSIPPPVGDAEPRRAEDGTGP